jgi:hypothetical protein
MDAYDRCTNLEKKILPIVLPSMVVAEKFSDHPCTYQHVHNKKYVARYYRRWGYGGWRG